MKPAAGIGTDAVALKFIQYMARFAYGAVDERLCALKPELTDQVIKGLR